MTDSAIPSPPPRPPWKVVWALSVTQIVSWGSLYYAISVLMVPIERDLGWSRDMIVGAYSLSLLSAGIGAFPAGLAIDRFGGRVVMTSGSAITGILFMLLGWNNSIAGFYLIWIGLGLAMSTVLYEPAFAVINACFGSAARKGITALTLAGGFASTVFWPLTQWLISMLGWRHTLFALALFNLLACVPLHFLFLPSRPRRKQAVNPAHGATILAQPGPGIREVVTSRPFQFLAIAFTANMLAFSPLSVHLIPLLQEKGFSIADAVWLAALVGPMQVAGRIGEFTLGSRFRARQVAAFALAMLPVSLLSLSFGGERLGVVILFVVLYGASNGIMTIVRGLIPAEMFGRERYGAVTGALSTPVIASRALGPFMVSLIWSASGGYDAALWVLAALGILSVIGFWLAVRDRSRSEPMR